MPLKRDIGLYRLVKSWSWPCFTQACLKIFLGVRMKKNLMKSMLLSTTLLVALATLSSCGKDKEVKSNPPAQTTPGEETPVPQTQGEVTPANPDNNLPQTTPQTQNPDNSLPQLPNGNGPGDENLPGIPSGPSVDLNNNSGGQANRGSRDSRPGQENQTSPDQQPGQGPTRLLTPGQQLVQEEVRAYQVDFSNVVAVKTGGLAGEGYYTSVGHDLLMGEFKSYNAKVSAQQQTMNNNLAKAIVNAKLARATGGGAISLTLTVDEFGTLNTYKLNAGSDVEKMNLSLSKSGTTGEMEFQGGFVKCLDKNGGCNTAYAKVKFSGGYARVIFRNTEADRHFLIQKDVTGNSAFATFSNYVLSSSNDLNTNQKIEALKLSSFEVVNGRAAAGAMLTTLDRQVVGFNIPMVVSSVNSEANTAVAKNADLSKNYDLVNLTKSHSVELSRSINSVRLVNNDGRGHFKLQLQMGTEASPASIWLVVASMPSQTISIEQIRSFENKLKAF